MGCGGEAPASRIPRLVDSTSGSHASTVREFYEQREGRPVWVTTKGPTSAGRAFLNQLCQADRDGLRPSGYALDSLAQELRALYQSPASDVEAVRRNVAQLDIALSRAFARYVDDLLHGSVRPEDVGGKWYIESEKEDLQAIMSQAVANGVRGTLDTLVSQNHRYAPLRRALDRYHSIAAQGGWPAVEGDGPLRPGESGPEVQKLRKRLAATGDLPEAQADGSVYSEAVVEAVQHFEHRHGLPTDGVVTTEDRNALNVSAKQRARKLAINLERYRWMPDTLGSEHVFVNLMDFTLKAYRDGSNVLSMPIAVGEQGWETVAFADTLEYAVFGPVWNVPSSIAVEDLLPQLKKHPSLVNQREYQILTRTGDSVGVDSLSREALKSGALRIRQLPGPANPLGNVKYMFPNQYAIYLHDTISEEVFDQRVRTVSHGCIRLEDPVAFGSYVFSDERLTSTEIRTLMRTAEQRRISVNGSIPVYIVYLTAWATPEGTVHFRQDRYQYDASLQKALEPPGAAKEACSIIKDVFDEVVVTQGPSSGETIGFGN